MKLKEIVWSERYSSTMEDDKFGRWARIAHIGDFKAIFKDGIPAVFELAWIKKLNNPVSNKFLNKFEAITMFPSKGRALFDTLEEAKLDVEKKFQFFMSNCIEE